MLMLEKHRALIWPVFVLILATRPATAAIDYNVTWQNCPAIARQMTMTEDEFKGLLRDRERPHAAYLPDGRGGLLDAEGKQKDGRPFVRGHWLHVGKKSSGPLDLQYRPAAIGADRNPYFCNVTTCLRYTPPENRQPYPTKEGQLPASRLDLTVRGFINTPSAAPDSIRRFVEQNATSAANSKEREYWFKNLHVRDLGFGLDRSDLYAHRGKPSKVGQNTQVNIWLCSARRGLAVELVLHSQDGAVSGERAIAIAKNAAVIMARKVFGVQGKQEKYPGEVGILDVYIASKLGETPQEDVRESKVKLGERFYLAVVFRPTQPGTPLFINAATRPSGEAVTASEARAPLETDAVAIWHNRRVLDSKQTYHPHVVCFDPKGQVLEDYSDHAQTPQSTVQVKSMGDGNQVLYWGIQTGVYENLDKFFLGLGRWDVELSLSEYRGKEGQFGKAGMELLEVSTEKVPVYILDNPEVSKKFLTEPPK